MTGEVFSNQFSKMYTVMKTQASSYDSKNSVTSNCRIQVEVVIHNFVLDKTFTKSGMMSLLDVYNIKSFYNLC